MLQWGGSKKRFVKLEKDEIEKSERKLPGNFQQTQCIAAESEEELEKELDDMRPV